MAAAFSLALTQSSLAETPNIAAASDLQFALEEVAAAFTGEAGLEVNLVFGSSGNFFRQIRQGAPFEVFLSADEDFIFDLAKAGLTDGEGDLYALGRIVLVRPHGSRLKPDGTLEDLRAAVADGRVERFAIANPEHAPYGRRAEEALRHVGLWEGLRDKLVFGETVSQAARFATSGDAAGGIIAYSLALSPMIAGIADFELIPAEFHQPLRQRMVLLKGAGASARAFYAFVASRAGREILKRHGFALPGEEM